MRRSLLLFALSFFWCFASTAQSPLITNVDGRKTTSLNGKWQYIVDPFETGSYDSRSRERKETDREAYWNTDIPENKTDRKEFGYTDKNTLVVPGDWNSQAEKFLYYEGTIWYKKSFDYQQINSSNKTYLYFGAVNYRADVYLNGKKLGSHKGGFTPFNFLIPEGILKSAGNFLVVKVDNKRSKDEVPTLNTDWWNYGGITRDVKLVQVPPGFIGDYFVQLAKGYDPKKAEVAGWVKLDSGSTAKSVTVEIPELKIRKSFSVVNNLAIINFPLGKFQRWSPENPKRYQVSLSTENDRVEEKIGFRNIDAIGKNLLLNGKPAFLRGICIHGEMPEEARRAYGRQDAEKLLGWAKELSCNMVRLAHYPHDEAMVRVADSLGILVWSEIPVYWAVDFTRKDVFANAKNQLSEMISRDKNRASVIVWSVGNETPISDARTEFLSGLAHEAKSLDPTRLTSAALQVENKKAGVNIIDDPLGQSIDLISVNQYIGWYGGLPSLARTVNWENTYNKPLFFSETGAEALGGFHADSLTRWSEEYQEWYYKEQIEMWKKMPEGFAGLSPWILTDFRSPRRNNPQYQEGWNNKGLISHDGGKKKKAFYVLRDYYDEKKSEKIR
ncbi:MAG: Beta-glucuronidase [Sphingobacteriaceae bacterium]|jgi:beta-glucuronidase|nr:Beta-glucuronidase [Sphingobacteriaceae bacterium]